jgi:hypothetical protein
MDITNQSTSNLENEDEVVLFVESKYCTICHIEQVMTISFKELYSPFDASIASNVIIV